MHKNNLKNRSYCLWDNLFAYHPTLTAWELQSFFWREKKSNQIKAARVLYKSSTKMGESQSFRNICIDPTRALKIIAIWKKKNEKKRVEGERERLWPWLLKNSHYFSESLWSRVREFWPGAVHGSDDKSQSKCSTVYEWSATSPLCCEERGENAAVNLEMLFSLGFWWAHWKLLEEWGPESLLLFLRVLKQYNTLKTVCWLRKKTKGMKRISLLSLIVNGPFTVLFKMLPLIFYFFIVENFRPVHKKKSHEKYKRLINHVSHIVCREKYCIDLWLHLQRDSLQMYCLLMGTPCWKIEKRTITHTHTNDQLLLFHSLTE